MRIFGEEQGLHQPRELAGPRSRFRLAVEPFHPLALLIRP